MILNDLMICTTIILYVSQGNQTKCACFDWITMALSLLMRYRRFGALMVGGVLSWQDMKEAR